MVRHWQEATSSHLTKLVRNPSFGLITDVDGTISPIVEDPAKSKVTAGNHALLKALTQHLPLVAAISGRDAKTLFRLVGIPGMVYVGNHGLEQWQNSAILGHPQIASFRPSLLSAKNSIETLRLAGVWVEDKHATITIHYRQSPDPQATAQSLEGAAKKTAFEHGLAYFSGRMIFELRPPLEINKGTALIDLIQERGLQASLYLGDDTTDVDAFKAARRLRKNDQCSSWSVGVVSRESPEAVVEAADFLAQGVSDVEALLTWLLSERMASST